MRVSVFTPTHDPRYLADAYLSIRDQPFDEWLVLLNGDTREVSFADPRVRVERAPEGEPWVGRLKREACSRCTGDVLLELDHDDLLAPRAVNRVRELFETQPEVGFVYSNTANFTGNLAPVQRYNPAHGWQYRPAEHEPSLEQHVSWDPTAASVSRIWYAPNHVRAWRRLAYWSAGGHSAEMRVLDDQDLLQRTFLATRMMHVDECLYLYRVHADRSNTWLRHNAEIQANTRRIGDRDFVRLTAREAELKGLRCVDLGGRFGRSKGWEAADLRDADVCADLRGPWPFEDDSVGVFRAVDFLEHLPDPLHTMREIYRCLAPGGYLVSVTPSTDGRGAFQDPTHCSWWNENSFLYYADRRWARYIDTPVRFQATLLDTTEPDDRGVCWVRANLISLKDEYRPPGLIHI